MPITMTFAYIYDKIDEFTNEDLTASMSIVSSCRYEKAMTYRYILDRKLSIIAELLLRYALSNAYHISVFPNIVYGVNGKPKFVAEGMPHFNISHCSSAVACVVSDREVGIDVEPYDSYSEDLFTELFNADESKLAKDSPRQFAELWTKKESFLKYTGQGLSKDLKNLLDDTGGLIFDTFHMQKGYACTICSNDGNRSTPELIDKKTLIYG